jgi:zinc transport system substrate-binding protein
MRIVVIMKRLLLSVPVLTLLPLAACGSEPGGGGVVTSMYPLEYVVQRVVGDRVEVTNLTEPGQDSHDFELGVEETAMLSEADAVVYLAGFQPAVDEAVAQQQPDHVVEAADHADLRPADDHAHEEGAGEGHTHEGEHDPHFWLDPTRMADVAVAVGGSLTEVYPEHADAFDAALGRLTEELDQLDADYRRGLAGCEVDTVVVSHDAFGYLAKYGLQLEPIAGLSPGAEPSPAHLAELSRLIEERGVTTVFSEPLAGPELADTLAAELGVDSAVLDPIEGLSDETEDEDYLSLMRANLDALREANGCR